MPSFEITKLQGIAPVRALPDSEHAQIDPRQAAASQVAAQGNAQTPAKSGVSVEIATSVASPAVSPPVDAERVEKIRSALRDGTYPLVPTKIADAMIAAQVSFAVLPRTDK
ncbi:MAG: flagellar biosynthesis anti-sigma factor FlgM [Erythrobacter sp.]